MSNSSRPTLNATPEANAPDTSAKTPKEKSADISVSVTVNGRVCTLMIEPRMTLLDALREELALTGTKKGCDRGECRTCTVHVDGRRVLSCMTLAAMQEGKRITTIEALERGPPPPAPGSNHRARRLPVPFLYVRADHFGRGYDRRGESGLAERRPGRPHEAF
jgi:hypothetical protein